MATLSHARVDDRLVHVPAGQVMLEGSLTIPHEPRGIVLFAHGSGSSRHSPRNQAVAEYLHDGRLATLLMDLLTADEEKIDNATGEYRFDVDMLAERLVGAVDWLKSQRETANLPLGLFGASTGAGAALVSAAVRPNEVRAVVSRGGRPDLAGESLAQVEAPTLLIVGSRDTSVIALNRAAMERLKCEVRLEIILGATHLFSEPGTLMEVARLARLWFDQHFSPAQG